MPRVRYDGGPEACDVCVEERFGGVEVGVRAQLEAKGRGGGENILDMDMRRFARYLEKANVLQDI
jgi:hypothetical protein